MRCVFRTIAFTGVIVGLVPTADAELLEPVRPFLKQVEESLGTVSEDRRAVLDEVVDYVVGHAQSREPLQLIFICTHNSRRSHLAQVWCQVAAERYGVPGVSTYSGGTEATACNIRTVRALRRAGLSVVASEGTDNPLYLVQYAEQKSPLRCFSKVIDSEENPHADFAALMCCSDADERCPIVRGADVRFALHYLDPKEADNTPEEAARYDERSFQIAQEMFYIMSAASRRLTSTVGE